ncbi:MAG: hypothetical protein EOM10_13660, partial [Opitutae bacterium]|nr:hypothetical protein [Opitutae bacterium]
MKKTSLLLALCCGASTLVGVPVPREKMVWAHLVGWAFPQLTYDEAGGDIDTFNSATDRTLLGRYTQTTSGLADNARPQIESARRYGIDGFCIDLVDPRTYVGAISRFYSAAEGTEFKIALCMDNYVRRGPAECVTHLADFIRCYKDHPNSARIDGRMVVFLYNTGMSMADFLLNTAITGGFSGGGAISEAAALAIMGTGAAADARPRVFTEQDQPARPVVFREEERRHSCGWCRHFVVNPFAQRCGLTNRHTEATDLCVRFESKPPTEPAGAPPDAVLDALRR